METRSEGEEIITVVLSSGPNSGSVVASQGSSSGNSPESSASLRLPPQLSNFLGFETVSGVLREHFLPLSSSRPSNIVNNTTNNSNPTNQGASTQNSSSSSESEEDSDGEEETNIDRATTIELRLVIRWLENNFPYLLLLFIFFLHQHKIGLFVFFWLASVIFRVNHVIKQQVALKENRQINVLAALIAILTLHIFSIYFIFSREQLWKSLLIFFPPSQNILTFWDALWIVVLNDTMVRFASMVLKCACIIIVGHIPPLKRRKQLYGLIEMTSCIYRSFIPISVWFYFLYRGESNNVMACIMGGLYLSFKFTRLKDRIEIYVATVRTFMMNDAPYGNYATAEQIAEHGESTCSICQDEMRQPISLPCNHLFCEECVSEWFEREKTCPICRAVVKTAGNYTHSDGGTTMLVQFF